jgi:hypothetical protein
MTLTPRHRLPWTLRPIAANVILIALLSCHPEALKLRTSGATTRETLALDELWETPLESCCKYGVYAPEEVEVTCSPADRCKTVVFRPGRQEPQRPRMTLGVIGLGPGVVDVDLRYRQPKSADWMTEHLEMEFVPAASLPTLQLGTGLPNGPFLYDHLSPELLARGVQGPARCELEDDFSESYACFSAVEVGGERRYPSCAHTDRCDYEVNRGRFRVSLDRSRTTGRIHRIRMSGVTQSSWEELGSWE